PGAQQDLADALGKALEQLSDEERKKLAEKLKEQAGQIDPDRSGASPMTKEQLEELQKELSTPEGQKQLADQLRDMANQPGPQSQNGQRQQQLEDAEKGLGQGQKQLEGMPMP